MATRTKRAPENETEADKFKRIAGYRLGNALTDIKLIGNCFNTGYEYTDGQVKTITDHLENAISQLKEAAKSGGKQKVNRIQL